MPEENNCPLIIRVGQEGNKTYLDTPNAPQKKVKNVNSSGLTELWVSWNK